MSNKYGPRIVTDGLVLCLDAADTNSYPGSGSTWYDLSGNGNNGALTNGPSFTSENGGSLVFDGTNDRIDCGTNYSSVITGTNSFSIECWVYPQNTQPTYADIWGNHTEPYKGIVCQQYGNQLNRYRWSWGTGTAWCPTGSGLFYINTLEWNHLFCIRNGSSILTYLNSKLVSSTTDSTSISPNTNFNFQIGTGYNLNSSRYFNGNIANFRILNRTLSANEVQQNYNATKGRFGL